jgi:hypothetical protein
MKTADEQIRPSSNSQSFVAGCAFASDCWNQFQRLYLVVTIERVLALIFFFLFLYNHRPKRKKGIRMPVNECGEKR